ncbi:uncharacterized protein EMH_0078140 [Eimeria mitis]|uniref:Uncharacterized protein n=1 Tax=Eimeria mitis TaxID=44415 RepID=U6K546_9EIME|nr:uncharacterized protein EMH_0078140 [Eimeria mitis]CDJ32845.1 hypothetical protein EMH_0078140 [Eimeria mitis]
MRSPTSASIDVVLTTKVAPTFYLFAATDTGGPVTPRRGGLRPNLCLHRRCSNHEGGTNLLPLCRNGYWRACYTYYAIDTRRFCLKAWIKALETTEFHRSAHHSMFKALHSHTAADDHNDRLLM